MNDWPVFIALMIAVMVLLMGAVGFGVRARKHWYAVFGLVFCLFGAGLICWGVSNQCSDSVEFRKC